MKNMKRILSLLIVAVMLFASLSVASVSAADEYALTLQKPCKVKIVDGSMAIVNFTPNEDGIYHFYSTGSEDTVATLYDSDYNELEHNDDGKYGYNFGLSAYLEKNKTYTLETYLWTEVDTAEFTVIVEKPDVLTSPIEIPANNYEYITFTPAKEGFYSFYSVGTADTSACLYDSNGEALWYNDDFTTMNFGINYYLFEGQEYYLEISTFSDYAEETIICIQEAIVPEDAQVITPPVNTTVIKGLEEDTCIVDGTIVEFTMSDGSKYQWSYDEGGLINGCEVEIDTEFDYTDSFYVTFSCEYAQANYRYRSITNPVKSIEYTGDPIVLYENMNGYEDVFYDEYDNATELFIYYYSLPDEPSIKINYTDGASETISLYNNELPYDLYWFHGQFEKPWTKGTDNAVTVSYLSAETKVPVHVLETPVQNIKINKTPDFKYAIGDPYYGYYDDEENTYTFYPTKINDLEMTVTYKDGTTETIKGIDLYSSSATPTYEAKELIVSEPGKYMAKYMYKSFTFELEIEVVEDEYSNVVSFLGDANEDYEVNIKDATLIQKNIARLAEISGNAEYLADVDGDKEITIKDATAIQKYIAGIEVNFPVGEPV